MLISPLQLYEDLATSVHTCTNPCHFYTGLVQVTSVHNSTSANDPECSYMLLQPPQVFNLHCVHDLKRCCLPTKPKTDYDAATKHVSHPALHHSHSDPLTLLEWTHHLSLCQEDMHQGSSPSWHLDWWMNFSCLSKQPAETLAVFRWRLKIYIFIKYLPKLCICYLKRCCLKFFTLYRPLQQGF